MAQQGWQNCRPSLNVKRQPHLLLMVHLPQQLGSRSAKNQVAALLLLTTGRHADSCPLTCKRVVAFARNDGALSEIDDARHSAAAIENNGLFMSRLLRKPYHITSQYPSIMMMHPHLATEQTSVSIASFLQESSVSCT
jgi:hypothetical protein